MGGNVNILQDVVDSTGFALDRPYDHFNVTYDALDRVSFVEYWLDAGETNLLEDFSITYTVDGHPFESGSEWKNHVFDLYRGRFVLNTSANAAGSTGAVTMIIHGSMHQIFTYVDFELFSNTSNSSVTWPSAAELITVVSTSASDTLLGTGIRTVLLTGVDGVGMEISETISLSGTTPVVSTLSYKRINSVIAMTSGSGEAAAGNITFTNASLQLLDSISLGFARSTAIKYTVPTSNTFTLKALRFNVDRLGEYEVRLMVWDRSPDIPPFNLFHSPVLGAQSINHSFHSGIVLKAETDMAAVIRRRSGKNMQALVTGEVVGVQAVVV